MWGDHCGHSINRGGFQRSVELRHDITYHPSINSFASPLTVAHNDGFLWGLHIYGESVEPRIDDRVPYNIDALNMFHLLAFVKDVHFSNCFLFHFCWSNWIFHPGYCCLLIGWLLCFCPTHSFDVIVRYSFNHSCFSNPIHKSDQRLLLLDMLLHRWHTELE